MTDVLPTVETLHTALLVMDYQPAVLDLIATTRSSSSQTPVQTRIRMCTNS